MKISTKLNLGIIAVILTLLVAVSSVTIFLFSKLGCDKNSYNNNENFVVALSGSGTVSNPYLIQNKSDLIAFQNDVNGGNTYNGKYVQLTANIDCGGELLGIGYSNNSRRFEGVFDGNGWSIHNFGYMGGSTAELGKYNSRLYCCYGLFRKINSATTIKNLHLYNINDTFTSDNRTSKFVGGLIGYADGGTISNCRINDVIISVTTGSLNFAGYFAIGWVNSISNCEIGNVRTSSSSLSLIGIGPIAHLYYTEMRGGNNVWFQFHNITTAKKSTYLNCLYYNIINYSTQVTSMAISQYASSCNTNGNVSYSNYGHSITNCCNTKTKETLSKLNVSIDGGPNASTWYYGGELYNDGWPILSVALSHYWVPVDFVSEGYNVVQDPNLFYVPGIDFNKLYGGYDLNINPLTYDPYNNVEESYSAMLLNMEIKAQKVEGYYISQWLLDTSSSRYVLKAIYTIITFDITFSTCVNTDMSTIITHTVNYGTEISIIQKWNQIIYSFNDSSGVLQTVTYNVLDDDYYICDHNLNVKELKPDTANITGIKPNVEIKTYGSVWQ